MLPRFEVVILLAFGQISLLLGQIEGRYIDLKKTVMQSIRFKFFLVVFENLCFEKISHNFLFLFILIYKQNQLFPKISTQAF